MVVHQPADDRVPGQPRPRQGRQPDAEQGQGQRSTVGKTMAGVRTVNADVRGNSGTGAGDGAAQPCRRCAVRYRVGEMPNHALTAWRGVAAERTPVDLAINATGWSVVTRAVATASSLSWRTSRAGVCPAWATSSRVRCRSLTPATAASRAAERSAPGLAVTWSRTRRTT